MSRQFRAPVGGKHTHELFGSRGNLGNNIPGPPCRARSWNANPLFCPSQAFLFKHTSGLRPFFPSDCHHTVRVCKGSRQHPVGPANQARHQHYQRTADGTGAHGGPLQAGKHGRERAGHEGNLRVRRASRGSPVAAGCAQMRQVPVLAGSVQLQFHQIQSGQTDHQRHGRGRL